MKTLEYKGYQAEVEYDDSIDAFHGRMLMKKDVVTFEATTMRALKKTFQDSVDDYLVLCAEQGAERDEPFSSR